MRGGERVLEVLCGVFPQAHLYTLTRDPTRLSPALAKRQATTSAIHCVARAPFVNGRFRALLPFFPLAVESFKLDRYSLVLSSSHCVAMGAIAAPGALHVAYLHSTLRYVREAQGTYEASIPGGEVGKALFRGTAQYLRRWEATAASRPHVLIANSTYTRERIRRYYRRDALVIEPPIDTARFERAAAAFHRPEPDAPFLVVSALVPNKRIDLAVQAFRGRTERLVVVGDGPERARVESLAGPNVTLLPRVDETTLAGLYASCRALVHTGVDDFGMVMVEALAAGKPVLACAEGGALDIVRDGETGLLIDGPSVDAVRATLDRFATMGERFDPARLRAFARRFDRTQFERRFAEVIEQARRQRRNANGKVNGRGANGATHAAHAVAHRSLTPPAHARVESTDDSAALRRAVSRIPRTALATKRVLDVALAGVGLVATAPLIAALGALIPLDSRGPALFCQERTGLDQRPFTLFKLRTMDDKGRVTRIGRVLRPLGLDELPQLWNVVKGDMSLIGPRPEVPHRVEAFERRYPGYHARHLVRPGITGLAQISGLRGDASPISERLRLDVRYMREWSLALDARILLRTFSAVAADTLRELASADRAAVWQG